MIKGLNSRSKHWKFYLTFGVLLDFMTLFWILSNEWECLIELVNSERLKKQFQGNDLNSYKQPFTMFYWLQEFKSLQNWKIYFQSLLHYYFPRTEEKLTMVLIRIHRLVILTSGIGHVISGIAFGIKFKFYEILSFYDVFWSRIFSRGVIIKFLYNINDPMWSEVTLVTSVISFAFPRLVLK